MRAEFFAAIEFPLVAERRRIAHRPRLGNFVHEDLHAIDRHVVFHVELQADPLVLRVTVEVAVVGIDQLDRRRDVIDGHRHDRCLGIAVVAEDRQAQAIQPVERRSVKVFDRALVDLFAVIGADLLPFGGIQALAEIEAIVIEIAAAGVADDGHDAVNVRVRTGLDDRHVAKRIGRRSEVAVSNMLGGCGMLASRT